MLVEAERERALSTGAQLGREPRVERGGDDGQVDREPEDGEQIEQLEQPLAAPARVVVAEEQLDGRGGLVERGADGVEGGIHADVTRRESRA